MESDCPLCQSSGKLFFRNKSHTYLKCTYCFGIYMCADQLPKPEEEIVRYLNHNNDVNDVKYQNFVSPIVHSIFQDFKPNSSNGLDYGAGTGPVITKILNDHNYKITIYDPFFANNKGLLNHTYDYVVSCEVIEHFHNPSEEFKKLYKMLIKGGKLYCMTHLYNSEIQFENWYYKNDPTHVFFYSQETMDHIKSNFRFTDVFIKDRLIIFTK
ncbi:class I SAM-dependent methyltransferase [Gramella sp. MT6]|uniref:class I SAM-dependent methyltransferase n=1 Tax=Gramella sp. MT6 TaxID=2705471 RepID=UPI001C5E1BA8|nr:class I SAM-dependent methyltransferase [Gramella sp. MT6]QYA24991.1 class I SAM-dependent methyltransferase [Gramella sp. MT6]